ncbi:phospholipase D nuclease [Cyathus striatus]|nr:phospholipase D nuclease [Cyathus striatus]
MDYLDTDEQLARAIALSMQEAKKPEVIVIDSDEEPVDDAEEKFQEELKRAMEASKAESSTQPSRPPAPESPRTPAEPQAPIPTERAQMEKERMERQKKLRKQAGLNVEDKRSATAESSDSETEEPPAKRQRVSTYSRARADARGANSAKTPTQMPTIDQVFLEGEFRQTATQHAEPRRDGKATFRLTEVLGQFFDPSVPVIMVAQPDANGAASMKFVLPNWIRTTPPLRGGYGCQHMKLFYKTGRLRVVISTANFIAYDWRNMENTIWLQDISLRSTPIPHDAKANDFPATLQHMLNSINVRPALSTMIMDNHPDLPIKSIEELRSKWDWSKVKVHLVASIAGKHEGWPAVVRAGHPRLMMAIRKMGMRTGAGKSKKDLVLECQGSSLGNFTTQWLNEFHYSARGESAEDWLDQSRKIREKLTFPPIRIVFPTKSTVQQSVNGERGGGTIFCRRKQWAAKNFPRDLFYDSKSKGGPVLMHSKMIIATRKDKALTGKGRQPRESDTEDDTDDEIQVVEPAIGWAYIGSHNFTPSAWGTLSGSSFNPVLNITNYEVGVVFPLKDEKDIDRVSCFERPPKKYTAGRDEPWIQEESIYFQEEQ